MESGNSGRRFFLLPAAALLFTATVLTAGYKARPWKPAAPESYHARLTSEDLTIAVQPMFRDDLAAEVFDKKDIVTRGVMPVAVVLFNDNPFPIRVNGDAIELICGSEQLRTLSPQEAVASIFRKEGKGASIPVPVRIPVPAPVPSIPIGGNSSLEDELQDFQHKFFGKKLVEPNSRTGGFLYFEVTKQDLRAELLAARIYIPDLYSYGTGRQMLFFEIDLRAAVEAVPPR